MNPIDYIADKMVIHKNLTVGHVSDPIIKLSGLTDKDLKAMPDGTYIGEEYHCNGDNKPQTVVHLFNIQKLAEMPRGKA